MVVTDGFLNLPGRCRKEALQLNVLDLWLTNVCEGKIFLI